ncbi:universal stress protein [Aurantimonas sp. VKM B-3413]|uniref:universal stress protein n=1 Tax=Aurantimonas sp. VKM B-3413 TaxID=2779401 RepID=UPI001E34AACB|nr:universal stress protein [Aurantimonas sp. VKM B-3413]MCB8838869.1 universal stress protein [Aurantimonas sp. VKM B-3413]
MTSETIADPEGQSGTAAARPQAMPSSKTHPIADIAVHLSGGPDDEAKLAYAETIASAFDAHLDCFLANLVPSTAIPIGPGSDWLIAEIWKNAEAAGDRFETALRERMGRLAPQANLRRTDGLIRDLAIAAARLARTSDLFVISQPSDQLDQSGDMLEAVLFEAGVATLIVPNAPSAPLRAPRTVVVGWRDTRECSHAIAAALPFMVRAEAVHLVSVTEDASDEERHLLPASDMARHLARHGVKVEIRNVPQWHHPAAGLLNEATVLGADLLVCGAYGRSRFREMIFGGVTRELLQSSPYPILMAH